jgi:hypothetical protein
MAGVTGTVANNAGKSVSCRMKIIFGLLLTSLLFQDLHAQSAVCFGARDLQRKQAAVYFDGEGTIYPDYFIADSALASCEAKLNTWYARHPQDFLQIAGRYGCNFTQYGPQEAATLGDSILSQIQQNLNSRQQGSITFLIHGFRKHFIAANADVSSPKEFALLTENLALLDTNQQHLFVEVYWDARYDCCFSASKKRNADLFALFVQAQESAVPVGQSLRKLLTGLHVEKLNIIAHSLGAKVAAVALFDAAGPQDFPTPAQPVVNLCLIAPAIPGEELFQYYNRRHAPQISNSTDNYRLLILYNENDFVLHKKDHKTGIFGPGVYRYGNTSLGCNHRGEADKLAAYFREHFRHSVIQLEDMSAVGKCHSLRCYCTNDYLRPLVDFMH